MKEDTELKETTSRRQFTKAAVIAAVAAPIAAVLASCTKAPPQNNSSGQANPAPSPSPTDDKDHKQGDGSPITVGGGGGKRDKDKTGEKNVSCRFKEDPKDFPEDPGNPVHGRKKFKNKNGWKIQTFKIRSKGVWTDYSTELPPNGKCTISILCAGDKTDVQIQGDAFGIELNTDVYEKQSDGYYRNPHESENIIRVFITGTTFDKSFDAADECLVCTDFMKADKSDCPS